MKKKAVLIFGYNEYGLEIAKNVSFKYENIVVYSLDEIKEDDKQKYSFDFKVYDISDDWESLNNEFDMQSSIIFCALRDEAENIFLTISLRTAFKETFIISLANNNEDANKLKMAGASKVIPIVETTAGIITDMLKKPIITEVLHSILYEDSLLKIAQIVIDDSSHFKTQYPADIEWSRDHGILVISVIHQDGSSEFIYSSRSKNQYIKDGDTLIVVGYDNDIEAFKKLVMEDRY